MRTLPLAALLATGLCTTCASAKPLLREDDPAKTLAMRADADGDGVVTKVEIADAAARAVEDAAREFDADWGNKLALYGMPADSKALDVRAIYAATKRILEAADADHDGDVTPAELRAYAGTLPPNQRGDAVEAALALDRDADMTISRSERDRAEAAFGKEIARMEALPAKEREAALHPPRDVALATWKASTVRVAHAAVALWRDVSQDGKASVGDIRDAEPAP